jgi:hypothetical protein
MKPDRGLIENIDDALQFCAYLGCESNALRFSSRKRRRSAVDRDIAEPHSFQELESLEDVFEYILGDGLLFLVEL